MNHLDRRRYPRYETEVEAAIIANNQEILATMIDIGVGGIGVISEKAITPGAEVFITAYIYFENRLEKPVFAPTG